MDDNSWCRGLIAVTLLLLHGCVRPVTELDLIIPVLPVEQAIATQIQALVREESGIRINLIPLPDGYTSELEALESGYGDIAFAPNNSGYREGIATILPLYPTVLHIATFNGRTGDSLEDLLRGTTVYAGPPGSIPRLLSESITNDLHLSPGATSFIEEWNSDSPPDVIIVYIPIDRERVMGNAQLRGAKLFSFGSPHDIGKGSAIDRAVLFNPSLRPYVIPIGTYGELLTPEPVVTAAVENLLVARKDMDDTTAYDLFAEILRLRPALFSERPELFQPLDENLDRSNFVFGLHLGVLGFLQRDEPSLLERYSGVAELFITLLVGTVSGLFAVVKIYRIRRKNRIDKFYVEVIGIRDSVSPDAMPAERDAAVAKIHALKNRAFDLLVDERLAADESFRLFIELTRDALNDIDDKKP